MSFRRRGVRWILGGLDALLQRCVPASARRICYASIPDFSDNAYFLFRHALREHHDIEHLWLVSDMASAERVRREFDRLTAAGPGRGHVLRVERWHSLSGYWAFLRSRVVAHTHGVHNYSRSAHRRIRLGLWHGMPIKCIGRLNAVDPNPFPPFATHYIATSHFFRYVLAQAFDVPAEQVLVCGLPRNDPLLFETERIATPESIRAALGVAPGQRIVVWLPTYRAEGKALAAQGPLRSFVDDLDPAVLQAFAESARASGCVVIVKLHPFEHADVAAALKPYPELRVLRDREWQRLGVQLYDLLAVTDALVSDVSSVLIDFAATGRPMGCLGFSERTYTRDLVFPLEDFIRAAQVLELRDAGAVRSLFDRLAAAAAPAPAADTTAIYIRRPPEPASAAILRTLLGQPPAAQRRSGSATSRSRLSQNDT